MGLEPENDYILDLIKYSFIGGNLTVFIMSLIAIGVSVLFISQYGPFSKLNGQTPRGTLICVILVCIILALVTFFGWYGAYKESAGLLYLYAFVIIVLIVILSVSTIVIGRTIGDVDGFIKNTLGAAYLKSIRVNGGNKQNMIVDELHIIFSCCGWWNATIDYGGDLPPTSCCTKAIGSRDCELKSVFLHKRPCAPLTANFLKKYGQSLMAVLILTIIVQFIAIVIACGVSRTINPHPH